MAINEVGVDAATGRKFFLDHPSDEQRGDLTFILSLHGGGSVGMWQRLYFPAHDFVDDLGLVVATPSSATKQPMSHWVRDADDEHLRSIVTQVYERFGAERITRFWLAGHSQGGMTSRRLLTKDPFFADRVDGWLSLSGGRLGQAAFVDDFGPPRTEEERAAMASFMERRRAEMGGDERFPEADFSHVFAVGEHEIKALPETSPWAEQFGGGVRERRPDVVDTEPGQVHDGRFEGRYKTSWGREPRPGTAEVYVYPCDRVVADVVRLDKGHTEGLEPNITRTILELMVSAPPT